MLVLLRDVPITIASVIASLHFPGINKLSRLNKKKKRRKRRRRKRKKNKNKKKYSQIEKMDLNKFM